MLARGSPGACKRCTPDRGVNYNIQPWRRWACCYRVVGMDSSATQFGRSFFQVKIGVHCWKSVCGMTAVVQLPQNIGAASFIRDPAQLIFPS